MTETANGRRSILLTGYPGFLGARMLGELIERDPDAEATCVDPSQPRWLRHFTARFAPV